MLNPSYQDPLGRGGGGVPGDHNNNGDENKQDY